MPLSLARTTSLIACATGLWLTAAGAAPAQNTGVDPAKAALIRRILDLTKAAELAITAMEASIPAQRAAMPQVPKEFWDEFGARARREMPRYIDMIIPLYDAHFNRTQLEQLVAFYESPLGKHVAKVQPTLTTQSIQAGQQWGSQLGAEVAQDLGKRGVGMPR